ncbi:MAG: (Fe-S)-binding protein [Spirochaetes bacterium]|nr:(Fe-S)-binding protein [Spirochaetota bacterium]
MAKARKKAGRYRWFREDRCAGCGACLAACPVVELPENAARLDRDRAIRGRFAESLSLSLCTTCNACDLVCPEGASPYELVLERFDAEYNAKGLPGIARMVFPNEYWNIWTLLRPLMTEQEIRDMDNWADALRGRHRTVMLTGFYTNIVPYLLKGEVFSGSGLAIAGSEGLWGCGGDTNKLGLIGITERVVDLLKRQFAILGVKKLVCFMEAEAAMLAEVLPARYGARFGFTVEPLDSWLTNEINAGRIRITTPLGITATVHDNCMSRYFGGKPQDTMRDLMRKCGCSVVEMAHNREKALCCGWAATIPALHSGAGLPGIFLYMVYSLDRRLREAAATGADAVVTGCPACYIFLSLIRLLANRSIKVYHTSEIVTMAAGGTPALAAEERCRDLLAAVMMLVRQWALHARFRKRFRPLPPEPGRTERPPLLNEKDAARIRRIRRLLGGRLAKSRATRALVGLAVRGAAAAYGLRLKAKRSLFIRAAAHAPDSKTR